MLLVWLCRREQCAHVGVMFTSGNHSCSHYYGFYPFTPKTKNRCEWVLVGFRSSIKWPLDFHMSSSVKFKSVVASCAWELNWQRWDFVVYTTLIHYYKTTILSSSNKQYVIRKTLHCSHKMLELGCRDLFQLSWVNVGCSTSYWRCWMGLRSVLRARADPNWERLFLLASLCAVSERLWSPSQPRGSWC